MADPKDPRITTTKGAPDDDMQSGPAPEPINPETGQHRSYWVLTAEERAKGFIAPVRQSYVHAGKRPKFETRPLTDKEKELYDGTGYILYEAYPAGGTSLGRFWTQDQLNSGCGVVTTMRRDIAETYARNPKFYGSTFCVGCREHLPVDEFLWDGTDIRVGSMPEE